MTYLNPAGKLVPVADEYHVDIAPDLLCAGKRVLKSFQSGWFKSNVKYPAGIFYQLGGTVTNYTSNRPRTLSFTYYFEVRATDEHTRDTLAQDLCGALSKLYSAHRGQYDDAFEDTYIKRITFTFTVNLGA